MKIGIITLLDEKNYGNRWQNFAMNNLLQSMGYETYNIYFWIRNAQKKDVREIIKRILPIRIAYLLHAISSYEIKDAVSLKKVIKFTRFTKKYYDFQLILSNTYEELCATFDSNVCDFYVVGSDQVWNPYYVANPIYFLQFIKDRKKRLAFMASFGSKIIPGKQVINYQKWISEMSYISVREQSGINIVSLLTGRKADQFLDPTLLVDVEIWREISKKPKGITLPEKYVAIFMFNYDIKQLENMCIDLDMQLIILNDKRYKKFFSLDPSEMLYILDHATMIFTDSFHIMALSIKFNKQFYVFKRKGFEYMFDRLKATLERLDILQCIYKASENIDLYPVLKDKFEEINYKCKAEKKRFLKTVCEITEKTNKNYFE